MNELSREVGPFLDRLRVLRARSDHTVRAYGSDLRGFFGFVGSAGFRAESGDAIAAYVDHMTTGCGAAPRTIRRRVACLRGFYRDLVRRGCLPRSPFDDLSIDIPRSRSLPRALTRDEATRLVRLARHRSTESARLNHACDLPAGILVCLSVGLRVSELTRLKRDDFDPSSGSLRVHGKGSRDRTVFVVDEPLRALVNNISVRSQSATLLTTPGGAPWTCHGFRRALRRFATEAGVHRRVTPHMLRHTAATLLLEDGVDVLFLQRLLGHENIATTALYARVADTSLKRALERAGLLASLGR